MQFDAIVVGSGITGGWAAKELTQAGLDFYRTDTRIVSESQPSERVNSNAARWVVSVPANGRTTLTAIFETRY